MKYIFRFIVFLIGSFFYYIIFRIIVIIAFLFTLIWEFSLNKAVETFIDWNEFNYHEYNGYGIFNSWCYKRPIDYLLDRKTITDIGNMKS
jgi:hypothetical protein